MQRHTTSHLENKDKRSFSVGMSRLVISGSDKLCDRAFSWLTEFLCVLFNKLDVPVLLIIWGTFGPRKASKVETPSSRGVSS
jgi:hypothetical protein